MKLTKKINLAAAAFALSSFAQNASAELVQLDFEKGEMMCFLSSIYHPSTDANKSMRKEYFSTIGGIVKDLGITRPGRLAVTRKLAGDHDPKSFVLVRMDNIGVKDEINVNRLEQWIHLRENRPEIWEELKIRDFELDKKVSVTWDTDKYYQVESFWVKEDKENEFEGFLTQRANKSMHKGGKIVHRFNEPARYETLGKERAMDYFVVTEWNTKEEFENSWMKNKGDNFAYLSGYNAWLTQYKAPRKRS